MESTNLWMSLSVFSIYTVKKAIIMNKIKMDVFYLSPSLADECRLGAGLYLEASEGGRSWWRRVLPKWSSRQRLTSWSARAWGPPRWWPMAAHLTPAESNLRQRHHNMWSPDRALLSGSGAPLSVQTQQAATLEPARTLVVWPQVLQWWSSAATLGVFARASHSRNKAANCATGTWLSSVTSQFE